MSSINTTKNIIKIALTGGIACGKTQVSDFLITLGVEVIDMDTLSREVVRPNSSALIELKQKFSEDIVQKDGFLDREKLRYLLFNDKNAKTIIEKILHPKIIDLMNEKIKNLSAKIVVVAVPLLIEKKLQSLFDKFIVVDCHQDTQIQRLIKRDELTQKESENILKQQVSQNERLEFAKQSEVFLITNNADLDHLKQQIQQVIKAVLND